MMKTSLFLCLALLTPAFASTEEASALPSSICCVGKEAGNKSWVLVSDVKERWLGRDQAKLSWDMGGGRAHRSEAPYAAKISSERLGSSTLYMFKVDDDSLGETAEFLQLQLSPGSRVGLGRFHYLSAAGGSFKFISSQGMTCSLNKSDDCSSQ